MFQSYLTRKILFLIVKMEIDSIEKIFHSFAKIFALAANPFISHFQFIQIVFFFDFPNEEKQ